MEITTEQIAEWKQLLEKLPPGPLGVDDKANSHCMITAGKDNSGAWLYVADVWDERYLPLFVAARTAVPALIEEVERLREQNHLLAHLKTMRL